MHAQLRISTTTKDTKSAKLARPAEALKNPNTQLIAAGFLLPGLVRHPPLRWCLARAGLPVIEMQEGAVRRAGRTGSPSRDW